MNELVILHVSSYLGSIGAEHYYGEYRVYEKHRKVERDGQIFRQTGGSDRVRHQHDGHHLERLIDAKEALYLTKKDNGFGPVLFKYKAGDMTTRFDTKDDVIARGKELFLDFFDETDILVLEQKPRYDFVPLVANDEITEFLTNNTDYKAQREYLDGLGFLSLP